MSNGHVESKSQPPGENGYECSRLNAVRHGILSQHLVLPWEDRSKYDDLLESLIAEHRPNGPTEHHLVEELAGLMWRKRRLTIAEASAYRAGLHQILKENPWGDHRVLARALVPLDAEEPTENVAAAIRATPEDTETELRDLVEDEAMTERALAILRKGKADAYSKALAVLHEDTQADWSETLAEADTEDLEDAGYDDDEAEDSEPYQPDARSLRRFLEGKIVPWYPKRRCELKNRNLIRVQALGEALYSDRLDHLARYEVHLDRKLERILGMLLKLQDLRRTIPPDAAA
jgi:hypothetical protein